MNTREEDLHTSHESSKAFVKRGCAGARNSERPKCSLVTRQQNTQDEVLYTTHESSNAFVKNKGVWA